MSSPSPDRLHVLPRAAALLVLASLALVPSNAHAYSFRRAADGEPVRWSADHVAMRVDPALAGGAEGSRAIASDAALAWSEVPSGGIPVVEIEGATQGLPGYHGAGGENGIYVLDEWAYAPALAVTVTTSTTDGAILDSDVLVDGHAELSRESELGGRGYDLQAVLTHELGHVLGLGESEDRSATMYRAASRGDQDARSIADDDVEGLLELYPASRPRVMSYGCAAGGRSSGLGLVAIAALGIAGVRRRATLARCRAPVAAPRSRSP